MVQWTLGRAIEHGAFLMALTSVLLTVLSILLVLCGIYGYLRIKSNSARIAKEVAEKVASDVAEKQANLYLQANFSFILYNYRDMILKGLETTDEDYNDIAFKAGELER